MPPFSLLLTAGGVGVFAGLRRRDQTQRTAADQDRPVVSSDRNLDSAMIALGAIVFLLGVVLFVLRHVGVGA